MGIHGSMSNRKKTKQQKRLRHKHRLKRADKIKGGSVVPKQSEIADPELLTTHQIRNRRNNSRTNVTLSGKKKRWLVKQKRYEEKEKAAMQAESSEPNTRNPKKTKFRDIEMKQNESDTETPSEQTDTPQPPGECQDNDIDMAEDT